MIKQLQALILLSAACLGASALLAQPPAEPKKQTAPRGRASPHETIGTVIDGNRVTIVYGRPYSARGGKGEPREIWGKLVPYNARWRVGSDEATLLITQKPIVMDGKTIPAGAHSLF